MNIPDLLLCIFICLMYLVVWTHFCKSSVKLNDLSVDRLAQGLYSYCTGQCCECVFFVFSREGATAVLV